MAIASPPEKNIEPTELANVESELPSLKTENINSIESVMKDISRKIKEPEFREQVHEQIKNSVVENVYGELFVKLDADDSQKESLRNMIADDFVSVLDSDDEIYSEYDEPETIDEDVRILLDNEDYNRYEEYKKSEDEKIMYSYFNRQLASRNLKPLTKKQKKSLRNDMKELKWDDNNTRHELKQQKFKTLKHDFVKYEVARTMILKKLKPPVFELKIPSWKDILREQRKTSGHTWGSAEMRMATPVSKDYSEELLKLTE